jgi:hypothetical protein
LEKILAYAGEEVCDFHVTEEDQALVNCLALPLQPALAASRKYRSRPCRLREQEISLDFQGNFTLCCGIFDARKYTLGNYIDMPLEHIQKLRRSHPLCGHCMKEGAHVYMTYGIDEMKELALANIAPEFVKFLDLDYEIAWERRQQRLAKLYDRYFSGIFSAGQKAALAGHFLRVQGLFRRMRRERLGKGELS